MKRIFVGIAFLALVFPLFQGCSIDDNDANFHFVALSIVDVDIPAAFELNETYEIGVTFIRPDGCTFFEGFDVSNTAQTDRDVVAIGTVLNNETACTQAIEEVEATFTFVVLYNQEYHFRFYAGDDTDGEPEYLEFTVPIEEVPSNN
ncbi:hypothetical protein [Allomuricauda sp. SCSIO 65647]|uniref:hypothetical protein n=1 Tax=Allomuricauda sp. SCSIO 65647 TaxID=2908843 RepID=UPI001F160DCD|nr:hypothetical protein [Muricauda sp. SCSIO 65647]UJH68993.1 hypothetical protein L0P89_07195 [Muricauda sp. SCSIO 65647]